MPRLRRLARWAGALLSVVLLTTGRPRAEAPLGAFDEVLDTYVRDGFVYYSALKHDRARLDGVATAIASATLDGQARDQQVAFWLNAYNALVLKTVIDAYPIVRRSAEYPARSVRQIPGAFEQARHRVAGRTVTLDQIEQVVLPAFGDPRTYFALGRGAVGGGRLRSEAYGADRLDRQLNDVAAECVARSQCLNLDPPGGRVKVSPIFSWRERDFVARYADAAAGTFDARSPLERAVIAFVGPRLLESERQFLARNTFTMEFHTFDWTLNDLANRPDR